MKKILSLFIILVFIGAMVFIFTGCEKEPDTNFNNSKSEVTEKKKEKPAEPVTYLEFPDESEEDREIKERYSNNNDYKIIPVSGSKFDGYLIAIYEPERVHVVTSSKVGIEGDYVVDMAKSTKAYVAINAGGFADEGFNGDGGTPLGTTITEGEIVTDAEYKNGNSGIVGFNNENKLVLEAYNVDESVAHGIRDCVSFGPFLVKDGEALKLTGWGALGPDSRAARTAIGQREDGIVLFLCVNGDRTKGEGATLGEVINIMQKYGAVNVSNLDGGTSSQMALGTKLINDPTSMNGEHRTRPVSTGFFLAPDDSDNGDSSAVK